MPDFPDRAQRCFRKRRSAARSQPTIGMAISALNTAHCRVAFNRQFSNGLMLKGAYTWSHAIDYADNDGWQGVSYNWDPAFQRNRATAGFDQRQVFQLGWVYELPFGPGKKFLNSGSLASKILGGWQFSGD